MSARWTSRSYQRFIREARERHSLTYKDAQALYRGMRDKLGERKLFASALDKHNRTASRVIREQIQEKKTLDTLRELDLLLEGDSEHETEDYSGSADY